MNKKLLLLGFIASITPVNDVMAADGALKSGFYTGLSAGYSRGSVGVADSRFNNRAALLARVWDGKSTKTHNGINGDVALGYRHFLNDRYVVGLSATMGTDNNKITVSNKNPRNGAARQEITTTRVKTSYKFTPAVVVGAKISDALLLTTELGVGIRRFKINHAYDDLLDALPPIYNILFETKAGFSGKVTLERSVTSNVSIVGSVGYEHYGTIRKDVVNIFGLPAGEVERNTVKLTPSYVTTNVGVMYRF